MAPKMSEKREYGYERVERKSGGITDADREFLLSGGDNLNSDQSRRNARRRIRRRIRDCIIDFDIIMRCLDEEDRRQIFDIEDDDEWKRPFQVGQKSMIEFLYRGLDEADAEIDFETVLRSGVHDAVLSTTPSPAVVDVEFDVTVDVQYDVDMAKEKLEAEAPLTLEDIGALIATGEVSDPEELQHLSEAAQDNSIVQSSVSPIHARTINRIIAEYETDHDLPPFSDQVLHRIDPENNSRSALSRGEDLLRTAPFFERGLPLSHPAGPDWPDDVDPDDADDDNAEE